MDATAFPFGDPPVLQNSRVKLVPFDATQHGIEFGRAINAHPEMFAYLPFGPYDQPQGFVTSLFEGRIQRDPNSFLFAVLAKTKANGPGNDPQSACDDSESVAWQLAGTIGILESSVPNKSTEIGFVFVLPAFQRTHVASNAIGLLLHFLLDLPDAGGLGLRRVQWKANSENQKSIAAAERMGFRREAVMRWHMVLPEGKTAGGVPRAGDARVGRHSVLLGLCWDDWEGGVRASVDAVMGRVA